MNERLLASLVVRAAGIIIAAKTLATIPNQIFAAAPSFPIILLEALPLVAGVFLACYGERLLPLRGLPSDTTATVTSDRIEAAIFAGIGVYFVAIGISDIAWILAKLEFGRDQFGFVVPDPQNEATRISAFVEIGLGVMLFLGASKIVGLRRRATTNR
ncbi:hypothetical protein [Roseiterribacter gracilis]|uniref:Uncharacterized protein n=1 Tax=Roseiterribacter gracilis TaxID=2812848 RepID=A0A8S8XD73_9PROT|nr:hypothetical protein TMPK1_14620 [Rhodospirillales bacterium TMPK1]